MNSENSKGLVIVISGPSGVGKGTVNKKLINVCENIEVAISATTRKRREGEVDGQDYYFISKEEFDSKIVNNEFIEYAHVHGNMYGTLISEVKKITEKGKDVILEIDVQGGRSIKSKYSDCISVFILPPNMEELATRLNGRATDDEETIKLRLDTAEEEVRCVFDYDFAVINDNLEQCVDQIRSIIHGEKFRVVKQTEVINELLNGGTIS